MDKTYLVWVTGFSPGALGRGWRGPLCLDGRKIAKPAVRCLWQRDGAAQLEITIHEGRNRQIRRMCQAAQLHANRLGASARARWPWGPASGCVALLNGGGSRKTKKCKKFCRMRDCILQNFFIFV